MIYLRAPASAGSGKTLASVAQRGENSFNVVRLAAAILVVWTHAFTVVGGADAWEPLRGSTGWWLGAHAVHIFFSLSGFLVAASWERAQSLVDFVVARILRIMPTFITVNLLIILVSGFYLPSVTPEEFWTIGNVGVFLARMTFLLSVGTTLNGVFVDNPWPASQTYPSGPSDSRSSATRHS